MLIDQLQHVLVARHDDDIHPLFGHLLGDGSYDIIGLVTFFLDNGDAIGLDDPFNVGNLRL